MTVKVTKKYIIRFILQTESAKAIRYVIIMFVLILYFFSIIQFIKVFKTLLNNKSNLSKFFQTNIENFKNEIKYNCKYISYLKITCTKR